MSVFAKIFRRSSGKINKKYNLPTFILEISRNKATVMGLRILVRWLLYWDSKWKRRSKNNRELHKESRQRKLYQTT